MPGDTSAYFRSFTATTTLYCSVTEAAACKQVTQSLVADKPEWGVELHTVLLALNASANSMSTLAVDHRSH